jgi:hypothetical protein
LGGFGAAVRLADINGDGRDDYLSITDQTGVLAYLNGGQVDSRWTWDPVCLNYTSNDQSTDANQQANGNVIALGYSGAKRHQIHFADMNGMFKLPRRTLWAMY